jgi:hypothetical protein
VKNAPPLSLIEILLFFLMFLMQGVGVGLVLGNFIHTISDRLGVAGIFSVFAGVVFVILVISRINKNWKIGTGTE